MAGSKSGVRLSGGAVEQVGVWWARPDSVRYQLSQIDASDADDISRACGRGFTNSRIEKAIEEQRLIPQPRAERGIDITIALMRSDPHEPGHEAAWIDRCSGVGQSVDQDILEQVLKFDRR